MNILTINGTALSGIYVDAAVSYNKPARRVESISVPGRNGNLIIDEGTFDNVLITYPVYEKATFPAEFDSLVNWLASLQGYQRIECSNDPGHYRLGRFVVPTTPTVKRLNTDGYYTISFDCKPQRYLLTGEVETEIDANPSETYGPADIVSFEAAQEDTISGAEFSIAPQQDLHGYDAPWPAGGGANQWDEEWELGSYDQNTGSKIINPSTIRSQNAIRVSDANSYCLVNGGNTSIYCYWYDENQTFLSYSSHSAGSVVTPPTGAEYLRFRLNAAYGTTYNNDVAINYPASVTTYSPYSNECPISGWTGANITGKGVNLWDEEWEVGSISSAGAKVDATTKIRSKNYIPVKPNAIVYIKAPSAFSRACWYDKNKTYISSFSYVNTTYTVPSNAYYMLFACSDDYGTTYNHDISINYPSTDTAYHASVGATKDISWQDSAGTVYGGTLAYLGGDAWRLTASVKKDILDSNIPEGSAGIRNIAVGDAYVSFEYYPYRADGKSGRQTILSDKLKLMLSATNDAWQIASGSGDARLYITMPLAYSTEADIRAYFTSNPTTVIYPLATPVTYDLTGEELARLVGQNNIFANCGQSTVVITEPTYFTNPGFFTSKPIIRVYGDGTFRVGDNIITIAAHTQPYIDIDSELQDCYYEDTNMNGYVTFTSGNYPELAPGSTYVLMGEGITKLIITPNWWEL